MKTAEILTWCVDNNDTDDFAIIASFSGHVSAISVEVYLGGFNSGQRINYGMIYSDNTEGLDSLFSQLDALKYYSDQSPKWADELAENKKQCEIAKLKLKLSELEDCK